MRSEGRHLIGRAPCNGCSDGSTAAGGGRAQAIAERADPSQVRLLCRLRRARRALLVRTRRAARSPASPRMRVVPEIARATLEAVATGGTRDLNRRNDQRLRAPNRQACAVDGGMARER